ncbi:MAG: DUF1570 domain-containing protein [Vicinamibacterales bacterium]
MTPRALVAFLILCLGAATARAAEPRWSRVDTQHFVVIGTGSEKRLQTLGAQFEGFREALTRLLSATATSTAVPTVVIAFPDDKSFKPFKPVYENKVVEIGGLFLSRRDVNYILLGPSYTPDSLRGVFHEYSHLIISNIAPTIPVWLNEGLAEYYSSFELGTDGHKVIVGRPILSHLRTLNQEVLIPVKDLIATTPESPHYNENSRRSMFYAEAWGLVHMLLHGEPDRSAMLSAYANDLGASMPADAAWTKHFAADDMQPALRRYAARSILMARQFTLPDKIIRAPGATVALSPATAEAMLGGVLVALARSDAAAERYDRALALDPTSALAAVGAARLKKQPAPAVSIADEDWLISYAIGVELLDFRDDKGALATARLALERAIAASPDLPNAQVRYAEAMERTGSDASRAVEALKKAHAAVPARDDYTFALARALTWAGDSAGARNLLGQVIARPHLPGARDQAREMLRRVVSAEQSRANVPASLAPPDTDAGDAARTPAAGVERPVFREVQAGESRLEGTLERIDCSAGRITLSVRLADRVARFQAVAFSAIEFISHRADLRGSIACGPRTPPDHVYVTSRPGDLDGTVVAVEFLAAAFRL